VSAAVIVVVEVFEERVGAVLVAGVDVGADPFFEEGLDEAFCFAVCLGAADAGVERFDAAFAAAVFPGALEAFAVVGEDFFGLDPECLVEAAAVVEEVEGVGGCFLWVGGAVGEPCVVVDADEEVFPAGFAFGAVGPAGLWVAGPLDAPELLDVDVQELAGPFALVADHGLGRGRVEARGTVAAEDRVHGRGGQAELPADRVRSCLQLVAGVEHRLLEWCRRLSG